ncbi:MAG: Holliday junction branch migration protein RuvA [Clostridia bacterium]|nr:Holliday junction branch migration protein RuvA [Clostridia bacterium]
MYAYIIGSVAYLHENVAVIENNGIGYEFNVSSYTLQSLSGKDEVKLYTYLRSDDEGMRLFGFFTTEEKEMFLKLITVSGIGPKVALQILSGMDLRTLAIAIVSGDYKTLSRIKGIGKKTAERVVLELRERVEGDATNAAQELGSLAATDDMHREAAAVLVSLGMSRTDAVKAVNKIAGSGKATSLESLITLALRSVDK